MVGQSWLPPAVSRRLPRTQARSWPKKPPERRLRAKLPAAQLVQTAAVSANARWRAYYLLSFWRPYSSSAAHCVDKQSRHQWRIEVLHPGESSGGLRGPCLGGFIEGEDARRQRLRALRFHQGGVRSHLGNGGRTRRHNRLG